MFKARNKLTNIVCGTIGAIIIITGIYIVTKQNGYSDIVSYYSCNKGVGREGKINIDGKFSDWDKSMLIAQGVANDSGISSNKGIEVPNYDAYALYGAWDNDNLYLMWELIDVSDVIDKQMESDFKADEVDIPQIIALDVYKDKKGNGDVFGQCGKIWDIDINYNNGIDTVLCFSSKIGEGEPKMFSLNDEGYFSYTSDCCKDFEDIGINYASGEGHISSNIMSVKWEDTNKKSLEQFSKMQSSYKSVENTKHNDKKDVMYEMSIPLKALNISKQKLIEDGIGVMQISTTDEKAVSSIPNDKCVYEDKENNNTFTCQLARVGKNDSSIEYDNYGAIRTVDECLPKAVSNEKDFVLNENDDFEENESDEKTYFCENEERPNEEDVNGGNIENGAILHTWNWSFKTIENNMSKIKTAGYTSIQTSPVTECYKGANGSKNIENWYWLYQPISYDIGNYQLGTKEELESMCKKAHEYDIKVIADVVPNQMTSNLKDIKEEFRNKEYLHTNKDIGNWSDRYQVTQLARYGLWDVNTQSEAVINRFSAYLEELLKLGVDGFRYDSASNIELPDDMDYYRGNFWVNVLDNNSSFQYGDIIKSDVSREKAYSEYMNITASEYGYILRNAIKDNDFSVDKISSYTEDNDIDGSKLITAVEYHTNFLEDQCETVWLTDEQIKLGYALIAARDKTTPIFFDRPKGAGGTLYDSRFETSSKIGDEGDDLYMDNDVVALNKFRIAMKNEKELLRNGNDSEKILMIERGEKGIVIINLNYSSTKLTCETNLEEGFYINKANRKNEFVVKNRIISGVLPARSIVVLYDKERQITNSNKDKKSNMTNTFRNKKDNYLEEKEEQKNSIDNTIVDSEVNEQNDEVYQNDNEKEENVKQTPDKEIATKEPTATPNNDDIIESGTQTEDVTENENNIQDTESSSKK